VAVTLTNWRTLHAVLSLAVLSYVLISPQANLAPPILVVWGFGAFYTLTRLHRERPRRNADRLSSLRLLIALGVTLSLYLYEIAARVEIEPLRMTLRTGGWAYLVFGLLVIAGLTDFFDGRVARAEGVTRFGEIWDEEIDAYFVLLLAVIAERYAGLGRWILLAGALRYIYLLTLRVIPESPEKRSRAGALFAKTACATIVITLIGATFPPAMHHDAPVQANAAALGLLFASFGWSWYRNLRSWYRSQARQVLQGVLRSLFLYYAVPLRARRRAAFYRAFLGEGDLAFDIGAHLGDRVRAWRRLGVRTVAVEPQPVFARLLRRLFQAPGEAHAGAMPGAGSTADTRTPAAGEVTVLQAALAAHRGEGTLQISDAHPTVSTLTADWISEVERKEGFTAVNWNRSVSVPVATLDELIERYGYPRFVKIDVEGGEEAVLRGLSSALPALSFEFLPEARGRADRCIARLEELGRYEYNVVVGERTQFLLSEWVGPAQLIRTITDSWPYAQSGDVYARLAGR